MNRAMAFQTAGKTLAVATMAAMATSMPRAEEQTELQKKTAELTQETALLNARTALLQAQWPQLAGGKEGKLTKDAGGVYELGAWNQVFERLGEAAGDICAAVRNTPQAAKPMVLLTATDSDTALRFRVADKELAAILAAIDRLVPPPQPGGAGAMAAPLAALAAVLPSIISVTKLFRTDRALHDETVSIGDHTLAELVSDCARKPPALQVDYPAIAGLYALSGAKPTPFGMGVERIVAARAPLQAVVDDKANAAKSAAASALLARGDKFVADLYTVPAAGGRAPIAEVLLGEAVDGAVKGASAVLLVGIVKQGGNSMVTSSVWREDRLYVGGGAVVSFKLIDQGQLAAAGTIRKVDSQFQLVLLAH